jgi:hypothetical protein
MLRMYNWMPRIRMNRYTMMAFGVAALGAALIGFITGFVAATLLAGVLAALAAINLMVLLTAKHDNERKRGEERSRATR